MSAIEKVNILLVDDRRPNLFALESILKSLGQNLVEATSGVEALKYLLRNEVAVILLDVEMPDMDGFQTATLIREREKTKHTPIIFLTAISKSDVHVSQGYSLGGVDYIFKPFAPDVLKSKVAAFVEMFKQRREAQRQSALLQAERDFVTAVLDTVASFVLVLDSEGRLSHPRSLANSGPAHIADHWISAAGDDAGAGYTAGAAVFEWTADPARALLAPGAQTRLGRPRVEAGEVAEPAEPMAVS